MFDPAISCRQKDEEYCLVTGNRLWGDDFSLEEISQWLSDEANAYFELSHREGPQDPKAYGYHALNQYHGYRFLPERQYDAALGIGAAYGEELRPVLPRLRRITILEPAAGFQHAQLDGVPITYVAPRQDGLLPFDSSVFDLITCFGVLHHIPNVSTVIREMHRVLKPSGYILLREPIVSMGDWRKPRRFLTKRERGIPLPLLRRFVTDVGLDIVRQSRCAFPVSSRIAMLFGKGAWSTPWVVRLDAIVSCLPIWLSKYHATRIWDKMRPSSVFYVLRKP